MLSLSPVKLLIVLLVAIVFLGPDKIPHAARRLASTWRGFRQFRERVELELRDAIPDLPSTTDLARMARHPVGYLDKLADMPARAVESAKRDLGAPLPADPGAPRVVGGWVSPSAGAHPPDDPGMN